MFDQVGTPLAGVRVTATSPTQIGGAKTTYSEADGSFRFIGLFPGEFEIRAAASKMKTIVQPAVKVGLSGPASVDLIMEVETAEESVTVVSKAPVINTKSAKVKEVLDGDFLEALPGANRNWSDVIGLSAGVEGTSVRGAAGNRNAANLDGFNTINPYDGSANQLVSVYSMAATEITTAGAGAAFGSTSGGVADMVTRSGSNRFELDSEIRYREPRTVEFFKEPGEDDRDEYWLQGIVNFGGPIIRDRLWYYLSFEGLFITRYPLNPSQASNSKTQGANVRKPDYSPPNRYMRPNFLQKFTYQLAPRHKLELLAVTTPERSAYTGWESYNRDPEADNYLYRIRTLVGVTWQALLSDSLFNKFQIAYQATRNDGGPIKCKFGNEATCEDRPRLTNVAAGNYQFGNYTDKSYEVVGGFQFKNSTEYFLETKSAGAHALTLGLDLNFISRDTKESKTGGGKEYQVNSVPGFGLVPFKEITYCKNNLTSVNGKCESGELRRKVTGLKFDAFLQDAWRATKYVTVTGGLGFHQASYKNNDGQKVFDKNAITPHVAATWDATHDGRTVLRSSYNQYADLGGLKLADFVSRNWSSKTCEYDDLGNPSKNCSFSNGAPGTGRRFGKDLKIPRTHEVTLGGEREIVQGVALGADVVYKKFNDQYDDFEVNRVWAPGGTDLASDGGYRNGLSQSITELRTPSEAQRRYLGTTIQLQKREGTVRTSVAYTWSQLRGRQPVSGGDYYTSWGDNPGQDIYYGKNSFLGGDRRHVVILKGTYLVSDWLQFGAIYQFRTGQPYNQFFYNRVRAGFNDLRAQQGYSSGNDLNDPSDDRPLRLPDLTSFDLQARANLKRFVRANLSIFCDYNNILALRGTTGVQQNDGPAFGAPTGRQSASYLQAGVRYVY